MHPNGVIVGYYLYFEFTDTDRNITDNRIITEARPRMEYNLTGLSEFLKYVVRRVKWHSAVGKKLFKIII